MLHCFIRTPDAEIEQAAKDAASAPEVQDDFDISEEAVAELDISDKPEVQVSGGGAQGSVSLA